MGVEVARDKKPQQQNQPQTWKNHDACTYKDINRNRHIDDLTDQQAIPFLLPTRYGVHEHPAETSVLRPELISSPCLASFVVGEATGGATPCYYNSRK